MILRDGLHLSVVWSDSCSLSRVTYFLIASRRQPCAVQILNVNLIFCRLQSIGGTAVGSCQCVSVQNSNSQRATRDCQSGQLQIVDAGCDTSMAATLTAYSYLIMEVPGSAPKYNNNTQRDSTHELKNRNAHYTKNDNNPSQRGTISHQRIKGLIKSLQSLRTKLCRSVTTFN